MPLNFNQPHIEESNFNQYISNVNHGSFVKDNPFHDDFSLKIQLYFDEFENVNPLGPKVGVHKLGAFYFSILNMPTAMNSKLNNIFLVSLFHTEDMKTEQNMDFVLNRIVKDFKTLESKGITIDFLPDRNQLKGGLVSVSADNLGVNMLLNLVESFNATNFCRFCLINRMESHSVTNESFVTIRTKEHYDSVISLLEAPEAPSIIDGVKKYCLLNNLNQFNTTDSMSVDIMHDILEGVAQWELNLFFSFLIETGRLSSLNHLNKIISAFNFGYLEKGNLPSAIHLPLNGGIKQKASQCWNLIRHVPLIFKSFFEDITDLDLQNNCQLILKLLKIMSIVFSPKLLASDIDYLEILIDEHHKLYIELHGTLKPKHHLMIHYPRVLRTMGPLVCLWTMRYESKTGF
jgi:hypothetical protein